MSNNDHKPISNIITDLIYEVRSEVFSSQTSLQLDLFPEQPLPAIKKIRRIWALLH